MTDSKLKWIFIIDLLVAILAFVATILEKFKIITINDGALILICLIAIISITIAVCFLVFMLWYCITEYKHQKYMQKKVDELYSKRKGDK